MRSVVSAPKQAKSTSELSVSERGRREGRLASEGRDGMVDLDESSGDEEL